MQTNTDCTVYRYNSDTQGFDRIYIPAVMWQESKAANILKSGLQSADSTIIYMDKAYAEKAPKTPAKDMLVKGNCLFCFDNTSPQKISESMRAFTKAHSFVTASSIDEKLYGNLQHIKVSAR